MLILATTFVYLASACFVAATVIVIRARKRLDPDRLLLKRDPGSRRNRVELGLTILLLILAFAGTIRFGIRAAPVASIPLFVFVLVTEAIDLLHALRATEALPFDRRRALLLPGTLVLFGIACWTIGCVLAFA